MRPEEFYLRDIIVACETANGYVSAVDKAYFEDNKMIQQAVIFNLMIIGEAAANISLGLKSRFPDVDWQSLKGFRNIITHEYFSLNLDIVWHSATVESLVLIYKIRSVLHQEYPEFWLLVDG